MGPAGKRIPKRETAAGSGVVRQKKALQVIEEPLPEVCGSPAPNASGLEKAEIHGFLEARRH